MSHGDTAAKEHRMRLLVANANTTEAITQICAEAARAAAAPGTEIIPATPRFGPEVISTRAENIIAGHALLALLAEYAGQVDAVLLAVSHDTALEAARQLMPVPVVGMTEAACFTACLVGGRFGLVTFGGVETYRERIAQHGLAGRLASLIGVDATPQESVRDPAGVQRKVMDGIARAVAEGAESVILGGGCPGRLCRADAGRCRRAAARWHGLRREAGRNAGGAEAAQAREWQLRRAARAEQHWPLGAIGGDAEGALRG